MWKFLCGLLWCAALLGVVNADEDPTITIRLGIVDKSTYVLKDDNRDLRCDKKPGSTAKSQTFNYVVTLANKGEVNLNNFANPGVECVWEYNKCRKVNKGSVGFRGWTTKSKYGRITVRGEQTPETVFVTLYIASRGKRFVVTDAEVNKKGAVIKRHIPFVKNPPTNPDQQNARIEWRDVRRTPIDSPYRPNIDLKIGKDEDLVIVRCEYPPVVGTLPLVGDESPSSQVSAASEYSTADLDAVELVLAAHDNGELYCLVGNRWADRFEDDYLRELLGGKKIVDTGKPVEVLRGKGLSKPDESQGDPSRLFVNGAKIGFLENTGLLTRVGSVHPFGNARFRERSDL